MVGGGRVGQRVAGASGHLGCCVWPTRPNLILQGNDGVWRGQECKQAESEFLRKGMWAQTKGMKYQKQAEESEGAEAGGRGRFSLRSI